MGLLAGAFVLLSTRRFGINISPDSTYYLAGADGVAQGRGLIGLDGEPVSLYAPGLSWLLAPAEAGDSLLVARLLNAALLGGAVFAVGWWSARYVRRWLAVGLAAAAALSPALFDVHLWLWSEPLFIALSLPYLALLARIAVARTSTPQMLVAAGLLAGVATLTRYAGVSLLPIAGLVLLVQARPVRRRLVDLLLFGAAYAVPVGAWLIRNVLATGDLTGERATNRLSPPQVLAEGVQGVVGWVLPKSALPTQAAAGLLALVAAVCLGVILWRHRPTVADPRTRVLLTALGYLTTAFLVLLVVTSRSNVDPLSGRLLAPLAVPFLVSVALLLDMALDAPRQHLARLAAGAAALALTVTAAASIPEQVADATAGVDALNSPQRSTTAAQELAEAVPEGATVLSNQPWMVRYLSGDPALESPRARFYASPDRPSGELEDLAALLADGSAYLVWLPMKDEYHVPPSLLDDRFTLTEMTSTTAGAVYELSLAGSPA